MADNPLLPQARLRELHALMKHCRDLDRKARSGQHAREGWLAASAMQLEPGDLLCAEENDGVQNSLQPAPLPDSGATPASNTPSRLRLPCCAGIARGFQVAATKGVVLAYARAGLAEPAWAEALTWAQREELPLLLACAEVRAPGRKRQGDVLSWETLAPVAQRCGLPVFPVDAEDAVAVYRVMYEAVLRARSGGGPAVLWGTFTGRSRAMLARSLQPIPRLESYLRVRGIRITG